MPSIVGTRSEEPELPGSGSELIEPFDAVIDITEGIQGKAPVLLVLAHC